jgi:hypothetical protein
VVTTTELEQVVHGHCIGCGRDNVLGRLVNEVDTDSGVGWTNVQCPDCRERGRDLQRL